MASKLELIFTAPGVVGQQLQINGANIFIFKDQRTGAFEVAKGDSAFNVAMNFYKSFDIDSNYLDQFIVNINSIIVDDGDPSNPTGPEDSQGLVTIEHPLNDFFRDFQNTTSFITSSITTTEEEIPPTLDLIFSEADANICGNYKLTVSTNQVGKNIVIEQPAGKVLQEKTSTGADSFNMVRPATPSSGAVKIYDGSELVTEKLFNPPVQIAITGVPVKGSPFGAMATIETNSTGLQYSLDGSVFTGSNQFSGLTAGSYTAYVKDDFGCQKTKTFEVTAEQTQTTGAEPYIEFAIHNSIRMIKRKDGLKTFLNLSSGEMPGFTLIKNYTQKYPKEVIRQQFRSSLGNHTISLVDCEGVKTNFPEIKKSSNIGRVNIYEGNYTDIDGKLAVFFGAGNIYNPDGSVKPEGHNLNGFLPNWYEEGLPIQIEGVGSTQIYKIHDDPIEGITYGVTQIDSQGEGVGVKITSIHNEHEYEVYEFEMDLGIFPSGYYLLQCIYPDGEFGSEIIEICDEMPEDYLEVQWFNTENDFLIYNTGIRPKRWLEYEGYFKLIPKSERDVYYTDTSGYLAKSKSIAVYEVIFSEVPMEDARGLEYAFSNSNTVLLNGVVFIADSIQKVEPVGKTNFFTVTAQFALIEQTMKGQQTINDVIDAGFFIVKDDPDAPGFWRIR